MDVFELIKQILTLITVVAICAALIIIVRMVLEHKKEAEDRRRRDEWMNVPLEKFSDYDEAERLAQKYEQADQAARGQDSPTSHDDDRAGRSNDNRPPTSPFINININSGNTSHSGNSGSYNGSNSRYGSDRPDSRSDDESPKSRVVAFVLCFVLGHFGGHYFYCGRFGMGVLYLLTFGLFGIGWMVDLIRIGLGKFPDRRGRYVVRW